MTLQTADPNLEVRTQYNVDHIRQRDFTIVGESHPNESYADLVIDLIGTGRFSTLYLEALKHGVVKKDYKDQLRERGIVLSVPEEGIFARPGSDVLVYDHNPSKYDRIIEYALANDITVHGIDGVLKSRHPKLIGEWAEYILTTKGNNPSLTLVGNDHAIYTASPHEEVIMGNGGPLDFRKPKTPEEARLQSLSSALIEKGVPRNEVLVIAHLRGLPPIKGEREGVFGIGAPIAFDSSYTKLNSWGYNETFDKMRELHPESNEPFWKNLNDETFPHTYATLSSKLPYLDEQSYIKWLKKQWVMGEPVLDYFFFHPVGSEPILK